MERTMDSDSVIAGRAAISEADATTMGYQAYQILRFGFTVADPGGPRQIFAPFN
jgi:hypothetical protein